MLGCGIQKLFTTEAVMREGKSLHHVAIVAKFLDENKPKTSLKK